MARIGRLAFLTIAVVFHLVYIFSIFDVYFVSPIVSGMRAFRVDTQKAPAKRLVLYVGALPYRIYAYVRYCAGADQVYLQQATDFERTKLSSSSQIPMVQLTMPPHKYRSHWHHSCDPASSSMARSVSRIPAFLPNRDLVMLP